MPFGTVPVPIAPVPIDMPRSRFLTLLQQGVGVPGRIGASLREFLIQDLGVDPDYVVGDLQTVFLDSQPVDDFDSTHIRDGCVLALSGAMPGLAGATLRRGGYYARMREGISRRHAIPNADTAEFCVVTLKLFNKPLAELAELVAARPFRLPDAEDAIWVAVRLNRE